MIECDYCKRAEQKGFCPVFKLQCESCRVRWLLSEPCKIIRQYMAESLARTMDVPNWKIEPNCGCKYRCKRHAQDTEARYKINF